MLKFLFIFFVTASTYAVDLYNEPLVITQVLDGGKQFIFKRREGDPPRYGITVKDPSTKAHLYLVKVLKCGPTTCLGQIKENVSGLTIRTDEQYIHSYNQGGPRQTKETKITKEVEEKNFSEIIVEYNSGDRPAETPPKPKKLNNKKNESANYIGARDLYLGYGSLLGPALKLGVMKGFSPKVNLGMNFAYVSSTTNKVKLAAQMLAGFFTYELIKFSESSKINFFTELGWMKYELDFAGVDSTGPMANGGSYVAGAGGEFFYRIDRIALSLKMGLSKNGLAATVTGTDGIYSNPYNKALAFSEIGIYYPF